MAQLSREQRIVRTSWIGIGTNVLLAAFKAAVGLLANSIAIILDAVNNLSDALSSVITIIATKLANRPADKKHPFGYGRIEYFSAIIIAFIVIFAGIGSLEASVKKILAPEPADYSPTTLIIVAVAVVAKLVLGRYVKRVGEEENSDALVASGADASFDAVISTTTLVSALVMIFFNISVDAYLGAVISLVIIKAGLEMVLSPVNQLLGDRTDAALSRAIKADVCSVEGVEGAYDLVLHSYGPEQLTIGAVHIEVAEELTGAQIQRICKQVQRLVIRNHGIFLTVGFYAVNTHDPEVVALTRQIEALASKEPLVLQLHGMYVDIETRLIQFDAVISFDAPEPVAVRDALAEQVRALCPGFDVAIAIDRDITD